MIRRSTAPFFAVNGDQTLRQEYDLDETSLVIDAGGFEGQWSSDIFARYLCTIHLFEPVPTFAEKARNRFLRNPKVIVHEQGLYSETAKREMNVDSSASSIFKAGNETVQIELIDVAEFFDHENIETVDLMEINIEGAEYDLLDKMIATGLVTKVANIQVQFHNFYPHAESRMRNIWAQLAKTHQLTYQFPFVWENWRHK